MSVLENGSGQERISESAIHIGEIFHDKDNGMIFLDLTLARFKHFDEECQTFSDDINYILKSSMISLTSENFENRIDSYFYIYRRFEEYLIMKEKSAWNGGSFISNFEIFRKKLYDFLSLIFASSKGTKPNLCTRDSQLLKRINISQHLSSIKTLDTDTINLFFALCKLSMQSSSDRLHWIGILSKLQDIKITLQDFIDQYIDYESVFKQYPLDTSTFIYLIQRIHPPKQNSTSSLTIIISLLRKLNINTQEFFDSFQTIFIKGVKENRYEIKHISDLFRRFQTNDLFDKYLSIYSSNVNNDELWNMCLHLCTISDINDIIKKHLIKILPKRISSVSMEVFRSYTQSIRECLTEIKQESRLHLLEIFERIYDVFVTTQIQDPRYSSRFTQIDWKDLLSIGLELTSIDSMKKSSSRLILLRESLFKIDNRMKNTAERIKYLFENFHHFNINLDPMEIIDDDWLKDYLITNIQIWLKIDYEIYQYLSNHHQDNRWIIHIWTRIMYLSLFKLTNDNSIDILMKLNEWMKNIKRKIYDSQDCLTLIFVQNLFELIIVKYTKSILSLPNIEIIMQWIFSIKENQPDKIDTIQVDSLIRNGRDLLTEILELKGLFFFFRFNNLLI
jgi:hypothetical protein